ncbi:MAG: DUF2344 domain-containing protein [Eubacterium sp.]|nr:DUF2344 domain-containing protein [Eubacterium sp.]
MKVRVKYEKTGPLKFISHLDVMRYFQKGIRRAGLDISYTKGMSPHQIISFAAPMPLMMTSLGEYFDAEFESVTTAKDMVERFNAVGSPYLKMVDCVILPDDCENSMAAVTASDYLITFNEKINDILTLEEIRDAAISLYGSDVIEVIKKTKKSEALTNIRPGIIDMQVRDDNSIYIMLDAGSKNNLKPELFIEAIALKLGKEISRFSYAIERQETYLTNEEGKYLSLLSAGETF